MHSIKNEIMIYSVFSRNYYRKYTLRWNCTGFMYLYLVGYGYSYHTILGLIPLLKAMCWNELTRNKKILIYSLARLDIAILISVVFSNNFISSPKIIHSKDFNLKCTIRIYRYISDVEQVVYTFCKIKIKFFVLHNINEILLPTKGQIGKPLNIANLDNTPEYKTH